MQQQTQLEVPETLISSPLSTSGETETSLQTHGKTDAELASRVTNTTAMAQLARYRKQAKSRYRMNIIVAIILIPVLLSVEIGRFGSITLTPQLFLVGSLVFSAILYAITWFQMRNVDKVIADIDDIRMIGPLAETWDAERFLKPKAVIAALRRLLPRLQASDANLLTREQRTCLCHAINWRAGRAVYQYDRQLTIAILKALQQIGDKEAVPYVRRAALSSHKDIRHAANDCLPFLLERAEEHKRSATYLRPADARTSAPDVLLRASTGMTPQQQTPSKELLRPHNDQE